MAYLKAIRSRITERSGVVIGSNITLVRSKFTIDSMTADSWNAAAPLDCVYTAQFITSKIFVTMYVGAFGFWEGTTQAWRFKMGGSVVNAGTHTEGSTAAHASERSAYSDYNHTRVVNITADLGNPTDLTALTYRVELAPQGSGTAAFGSDRGGHTGTIVGCPSPSFLRVEEIAV